jgi:hypothetical protein
VLLNFTAFIITDWTDHQTRSFGHTRKAAAVQTKKVDRRTSEHGVRRAARPTDVYTYISRVYEHDMDDRCTLTGTSQLSLRVFVGWSHEAGWPERRFRPHKLPCVHCCGGEVIMRLPCKIMGSMHGGGGLVEVDYISENPRT